MKRKVRIGAFLICTLISFLFLTSCDNTKPKEDNLSDDIDSLIPTQITEDVYFAKHMGTWYFTSYTDYDRDDITPVQIVAVGADDAQIRYNDGTVEYITFISENSAVRYDNDSQARGLKILYEFNSENGKEHIDITPTFSSNGEVSAQPGPGMYRNVDDFFFNSNTEAATVKNNSDPEKDGSGNIKDKFSKKIKEIEAYANEKAQTANTQMEINQATYDEYLKWDALLNEIYQHLKKTMPNAEFSRLEADEKEWIKKKEAAMEADSADYVGGTMYAMMKNSTGSEYTKERCEYLISLIK